MTLEYFNEEGKTKVTLSIQHNGKEASYNFVMDNKYDVPEDFDRKIIQATTKFDDMFQEGYFN